jgi:exopolyphosphatase/guanosine-5'-triphosphate,3'-diphosphate pyrophosphatase
MLNHEFNKNFKKNKNFGNFFMKKVAAIDVGSNAVRLTIAEVISPNHFKVIEKIRYPIRLGVDVFQYGVVGQDKIIEIMSAFEDMRYQLEHNMIQDVYAVATSALRDAGNSKEIISKIFEISKIKINVITGLEEAHYLFKILAHEIPILNGKVLLIDIGGGSTEISFINDGVIEKIESYNIGTIRLLNNQPHELEKLITITKSQISSMQYKVIGTGGNLRRMGKLRKKIFGRADASIIHKSELIEMHNKLSKFTPLQIMKKYDLKHDRAEVIVPALEIMSSIIAELNIDVINLPKVGLSDALILELSNSSNFTFMQ